MFANVASLVLLSNMNHVGVADAAEAARGELANAMIARDGSTDVEIVERKRALNRELVALLTESEVCTSGGMSRQLECPLCYARLDSLAFARRHLDAHYPRDSPLCPVASCSRLFAHPNSVRNHMRIKHPRQWDKMKTLKWSCGWSN